MSRKSLAARRIRNQELAKKEALNRCGICKVALPVKVFLRWGDPKMYCSKDCLDEAITEHA